MIRASIDLGTNTCLLLVVDWNEPQALIEKVLLDETAVVRLGEGVDVERKLQDLPMERTLHCLKKYAMKVRSMGIMPDQVRCVATSQARDAKNSADFFTTIRGETGFSFDVITGEEEAKYTFLGALLPGMDPHTSAVIDIGGGSTEIISSSFALSMDMGSVRFTERFFKSNSSLPQIPVTDEEFWKCQEAVDEQLQQLIPWRKKLSSSIQLVAVAGTATSLAAWHLDLDRFDTQKVDQVILTRGDLHRQVEELKWRTVKERSQLPCMEPMRADVILAGSLILWRTLEVLEFPHCHVSTRGLRYGILQK